MVLHVPARRSIGSLSGPEPAAGSPLRSRRCWPTTLTDAEEQDLPRDLASSAARTLPLAMCSGDRRWWTGYLDIGSDIVFWHAPKVTLYHGWRYVLVLAGPDQVATWRPAPLDVRIVPLGPRGPAPLAPPNAVSYVMSGMPLRGKRSSIPRMSLSGPAGNRTSDLAPSFQLAGDHYDQHAADRRRNVSRYCSVVLGSNSPVPQSSTTP